MGRMSPNLPPTPRFPILHHWAVEAEDLLVEQPDLSLVRIRQMAELLVRALETRHNLSVDEEDSLFLRIQGLEGFLPARVVTSLHKARMKGNDAVHVSSLNPPAPAVWDKVARKRLLGMARAWAWYLGTPEPHQIVVPESADKRERLTRVEHARLDEAERLVEKERSYAAAEELVVVDFAVLDRGNVDALQLDLIRLRQESIRRAASNHKGEPPSPRDPARSRRLVAWGDPVALEEVVHLHNRHAVALLNVLQLEKALDVVTELVEWRDAREILAPSDLEDLPIRDWQKGAVLGTQGQVLGHLAHARRDPDLARRAAATFQRAKACFSEPGDRDTQDTYRLHALVEVVRQGGALERHERAEVVRLVDAAPLEALREGWSVAGFRLAAALKAALVLDLEVPIDQVLRNLPWVTKETALPHPVSNVAGALCLLEPGKTSRLLGALRTTVDKSTLNGWRAACFVAAAEGTKPPAPPFNLRPWHDDEAFGLGERSAFDQLPFNYA